MRRKTPETEVAMYQGKKRTKMLNKKEKNIWSVIKANYQIYVLLIPAILFFAIFCYGPMYGIIIAFKDYNTGLGIMSSPWVGLKHFKRFIDMPVFWNVLKNTLLLSLYHLAVNFPIPIVVALMINEVKEGIFKKTLQTVIYAPHFISTVIICSMITLFLSPSAGFVNKMMEALGGDAVNFMSNPDYFKHIYVWSNTWQHTGWSSIIYVAALSGVDMSLHESASIDGAGRLQRIWHINLPSLRPTIVIQLILCCGSILVSDFEKVLILQKPAIMETADVLSTYVYRIGIQQAQFSLSTAIGLFNSIFNFIFLIFTNFACRKIGDTSLW